MRPVQYRVLVRVNTGLVDALRRCPKLERTPVSFTHSDRAGLGQGRDPAAEHSLSYGQGA